MRIVSAPLCRATAVVVSLIASQAFAWSHKEHIQFTRMAAERIVADPAAPAELKAWLMEQTPLLASIDAEHEYLLHESIGKTPDPAKLRGLTWWAVVPDIESLDKNSKPAEPANRHERFNHYVDLEFLNAEGPKRQYQSDLSSLPDVSHVPRDVKSDVYVRAGYLPLARQNAYDRLVAAFKAGRLASDPAKPEDLDHAVRWAGYLAHYSEDNTQPHHATMDFRSGSYFKGLKNAPDVHAEMEYRMADDATQPLPELREEYWTAFAKELESIKDPVANKDVFAATLEVSTASYHNLPLIGDAAKAAMVTDADGKPAIDTTKFFHFKGTVDGKETTVLQMKAHQTAWAVVRAEGAIRQAWAEAHPAPTTMP